MENQVDPKRFKATGQNANINIICERHDAGYIAICPHCETDLVIAFTWEAAKRHDGHPGIFCPKDSRHFQIVFNIGVKSTAGTNAQSD
jgi:hypothetical protein